MINDVVYRKPDRHWLLASLLLGFLIILIIASLFLLQLNLRLSEPLSSRLAIELVFLFPMLMFAFVGTLIITYHPRHTIGWLFYIVGSCGVFSGFGTQYSLYALYNRPSLLRESALIVLLSNTAWLLFLVPILTLLPLLFPTGRPLSPRWGRLVWLTVVGLAVVWLTEMIRPTVALSGSVLMENPYGIPGAASWVEWINNVSLVLLMSVALLSVTSLVIRYRYGSAQERAQIRWFALSATLIFGALLASELFNLDSDLVFALLFSIMPIAAAMAILKYRLYDIDLLIRRTLVYSALTGLLALIYFSSIIFLQLLFATRTGTQESNAAVVLSTLLIAMLFTPLRGRIQAIIDRRFYRRKYNAAQALAHFAATTRNEVDPDLLTAELVQVIQETLQPISINLWLFKK